MSNVMIERVAEVLCKMESGLTLSELASYSQPRDATFFRGCARAAIEAMREPTEEMRAAGRDAIQPNLYQGRVAQRVRHQWQIADEAWAAMISAASAEQ